MIKLTKLNGEKVVINADLIEVIKGTPDTVITLTTDKNILVTETVDEVVRRVICYKKKCFSVQSEN